MANDFVDDFVSDFVTEAKDLLDLIEPDLLLLEKEGSKVPPELVNRIFRTIHSIKGGAGFSGFEALKQLSHAIENVLTKIQNKQVSLDDKVMDAILEGVDKIRLMVNDIYSSSEVCYLGELEKLNLVLAPKSCEPNFQEIKNSSKELIKEPIKEKIIEEELIKEPEEVLNFKELQEAIIKENPQEPISKESDLKSFNKPHQLNNQANQEQADIQETNKQKSIFKEENFDKETIKDFVNDIREVFDSIEPDLLEIEKNSSNVDNSLVNRIFRAIHSIKGCAGFCGFENLKQISNAMENVLTKVRDKAMSLDSHKIDALLSSVDKIRTMINDIYSSEEVSCEIEIADLKSILENKPVNNKANKADDKADKINKVHEIKIDNKLDNKIIKESHEKQLNNLDNFNNLDSSKNINNLNSLSKVIKPVAMPTEKTLSIETIRVPVNLVDRLMNLAGELVLGRNQLRQAIENFIEQNPKINPVMQNVDMVTSAIQENIMQMRMQPVGNILNKFPRTVRDLAKQINKEVELLIEGADVELDKSVLERLSNPLNHIVRNCVDHGIEAPEVREGLRKSRVGKVYIKAFHEGGQVNVVIKDDGRGINFDKVVTKAIGMGLITYEQAQKMSKKEKMDLVFLPGLSTAESVTDISGRGVGMDVVKTDIEQIGGHIDIESFLTQGTTVHIVIPLTLAIIPCLIIGIGNLDGSMSQFAIPQINVQELVCIKQNDPLRKIEKIGESYVLRNRERLLPILHLSDVLGIQRTFIHPMTGKRLIDKRTKFIDRREEISQAKSKIGKKEKQHEKIDKTKNKISDSKNNDKNDDKSDNKNNKRKASDRRRYWRSDIFVVVLKVGGNIFGLCVDALFDNEEIVVKPLSMHIKDCKCFSGSTIMGDGKVAMILDAGGIANYANLRFTEIKLEEKRRQEELNKQKKSIEDKMQSIIIFNNSLEEYFALFLKDISRLEIIKPSDIRLVGKQEYLSYRGDGLPIIKLERFLPISALPKNLEEFYVIVPKAQKTNSKTNNPVGILVSKILDTIDAQITLQKDATTVKGLLGSAIIDQKFMFFLNIEELLELFESSMRNN